MWRGFVLERERELKDIYGQREGMKRRGGERMEWHDPRAGLSPRGDERTTGQAGQRG